MTTSAPASGRSSGRTASALSDVEVALYRCLGHLTVDRVFPADQAEAVIHSTRRRRACALHYVNARTFFEHPALPYDDSLKLRIS